MRPIRAENGFSSIPCSAYAICLGSVFADQFAIYVSLAYKIQPTILSSGIGVFAFMMQLYFDFSGYSLMAIGLGRCFGFRFPRNFNRPYLAQTFQDFWRRWHITLGTWMRDYLYKPLGGSQKSIFRTQINLIITMILAGFWHGADWTFIVWGAWHGLLLCSERLFLKGRNKFPLGSFSVCTGYLIGLVFFRAESLSSARTVLLAMTGIKFAPSLDAHYLSNPIPLVCCLLGIVYCFVLERKLDVQTWIEEVEIGWMQRLTTTALFVLSLPIDGALAQIPFLYFQF